MKTNSATDTLKKTHQDSNYFKRYEPDHPINFPHSKHAGAGIDCKYCHTAASDSKTTLLPSAKICMNCHKSTTGGDLLENYPGKNGIAWKKVEEPRDSVYFNPATSNCIYIKNGHSLPKDTSQLGNYECAKCHY